MIDVHMILNGKPVTVTVEDGEILLDTIRERLGLTGTKRGCEVGECGACTVLIDDMPVDSCIYLTAWAEGHRVMTIEGVEINGELSIKNFTSGISDNAEDWYVFFTNVKSGTVAVILELNEKSIEHVNECYKKKLN